MNAEAIRAALLKLAAERATTFCPSEAARALAKDWRPLMQPVREVAAALIDEGELLCTQRGETADPLTAKGPIRLSRQNK
jgi:hypothetical protein